MEVKLYCYEEDKEWEPIAFRMSDTFEKRFTATFFDGDPYPERRQTFDVVHDKKAWTCKVDNVYTLYGKRFVTGPYGEEAVKGRSKVFGTKFGDKV